MSLTANSETAQDIAAAFVKFQDPVSEAAPEIASLIAELFAVSAALQELHAAQTNQRYHHRRDVVSVEEDKRTVLRSVEYTFKDINRRFGDLGRNIYRTHREAYTAVWRDINCHFEDECHDSLVQRLEYYKIFIVDLACIVQG